MVNVTGIWDESYRSYPGRSHGLADVFFGSTDNSRCEKSAEVMVDTDTSLLKEKEKQEASRSVEGLNLIISGQ